MKNDGGGSDQARGPAVHAQVIERGDEGFRALYEQEYEPMLRVAILLVGREEPAQDAVHDAFAKVYERWAKIDRPGAYLRTCVVNRCRDVQRRRFLERRRAEQAAPPATFDLGARELLDALDKLPAKRRAALVLRYYGDLTDAEVAATLGVPEGTAKSLASRGLAELRRVVER